MVQYIVSCGNPEGTDWTMILEHEQKFTHDEFQDICEEAIAKAMDDEYAERGRAFVCAIDTEKVFKNLSEKGFREPQQEQVGYYLEPYWGRDSIRSKHLLEVIDRKDKDDV